MIRFGFVRWSEVPVETVDRVEVVRGGGATLWGNDAMGSVINILFHTDPHFLTHLAVTAPLRKGLEAFLQMENLLDRRYVGTNDGFTAPLPGRPFTAVAGVR